MLVISVGVLAAVSLFPTSMDSNKKAIDDTQIALYADYVFNTLQGYASTTNYPWSFFVNTPDQINVAAAAQDMWVNPTNLLLTADGSMTKLVFLAPDKSGEAGAEDVEEVNIEARLTIAQAPDYPSNNVRRAILEVWPFSSMNTNGYHMYQMDIFRGEMP